MWWGRLGSNQRPIGYEPTALTPELRPHRIDHQILLSIPHLPTDTKLAKPPKTLTKHKKFAIMEKDERRKLAFLS